MLPRYNLFANVSTLQVMQKGGRGARHELDLLSALMAVPGRAHASDNFKLNLFGDDDMPVSVRWVVVVVACVSDNFKLKCLGMMIWVRRRWWHGPAFCS